MKMKVNILQYLILCFLTFGCASNKSETIEKELIVDSNNVDLNLTKKKNKKIKHEESNDKGNKDKSSFPKVKMDTLVLFEDSIAGVLLPFKKGFDCFNLIKQTFPDLKVEKEIGQQDGPDFPLFSIRNGNDLIIYFFMDIEDSTKLNEVVILDDIVKDEYDLKIGDSYEKIKTKRADVQTFTDYHQHTYAYFDNSKIRYEINGQADLSENADMENLVFTEEQIRDWKIERIIWNVN